MNTDAFFRQGKSHLVCQDYARAQDLCAALADGCSSSPHTDMGARYLVNSFFNGAEDLEYGALCQKPSCLPKTCLDATLMTLSVGEEYSEVSCYGDGVIVIVPQEGDAFIYDIDWNDMPAYLSYRLNPERLTGVTLQGTVTTGLLTSQCVDMADLSSDVFHLQVPNKDYKQILLFSDGVKSFQRKLDGRNQPVDFREVLLEMTKIKATKGRYLARRSQSFLDRFCAKEGWFHTDDFSVVGAVL